MNDVTLTLASTKPGILARLASWAARSGGMPHNAIVVQPAPTPPPTYQNKAVGCTPYATRLNWEPGDDVRAFAMANGGTLLQAAQLTEAMLADGTISGLLQFISAGLVQLPMKVEGNARIVRMLLGNPNTKEKGVFWKMHPKTVVCRIAIWGILLGGGFGEFVRDKKTGIPTLRFVEPHRITWTTDQETKDQIVTYNSDEGPVVIEPGDARWFVFAPWGLERFWTHGKWRPCGKAWLDKTAAEYQRTVAGARHSLGLTWIERPKDESRSEDADMLCAHIASSPTPPVFHVETGWKVNHTSITTDAHEQWKDAKEEANADIAIALTGQTVTVGTDGSGWSKGDIHAAIAQTFVDDYGMALAEAFNVCSMAVIDAREGTCGTTVTFVTGKPRTAADVADAIGVFSDALTKADAALAPHGKRVNIDCIAECTDITLDDINTGIVEDTEEFQGINIVVENAPGSIRSGVDEFGNPWAVPMGSTAYGFIPGTEGTDGDPLDVFIGPSRGSSRLFVLKQNTSMGEPDELKLFLGFDTIEAAKQAWSALVGRPELDGGWREHDIEIMQAFFSAAKPNVEPAAPAQAGTTLATPEAPIEASVAASGAPLVDAPDDFVDPTDRPASLEAVKLAGLMTDHKLDRCSHGRVNACERCGVRREYGIELDAAGKFAGWQIAWRAIGDAP